MKRQRLNKTKQIILGVTGGIGSGKTTVSEIFGLSGAKIIDADRISHDLIKPGNKIHKKIIKAFGKVILKNANKIDRDKLSGIVFNNSNLLRKLNNILHPLIIGIIKQKIRKSKNRIIVLDAPLLVELGLENLVDKIIVVNLSRVKQIARIRAKTGKNKADILRRIKFQLPLEKKLRVADFIIDNNGTKEMTKKQVIAIRRKLWTS